MYREIYSHANSIWDDNNNNSDGDHRQDGKVGAHWIYCLFFNLLIELAARYGLPA